MGLCVSKPSVAGSPEHYAAHATEQATPSTPSSPEASMSPSLYGLASLGSPGASSSRRPLSPLLELNTSDLVKQKSDFGSGSNTMGRSSEPHLKNENSSRLRS